jgi:hypothetical protein
MSDARDDDENEMRDVRPSRPRLSDRLRDAAVSGFVGRAAELSALLEGGDAAPIVTFVHGMGGIGKSALLAVLAHHLDARGTRVVRLDGRSIEPSPRGVLTAIGVALDGVPCEDVHDLDLRLRRFPTNPVFVVDEIDRLHLVGPWVRQTLLPALPGGIRHVFAGRLAPENAWIASPGWSEAVRVVRLGPLPEGDARALLARRGVADAAVPQLLELAHGSPLALELGARAAARGPLPESDVASLFDALARRCVDDVEVDLRRAVEAACVVRRVTRPLLESMLGRECDETFVAAFAALPFVERTHDGLAVHEAVRQAVRERLAVLDPDRLARLRAGAWAFYEAALRAAPARRWTWRAAADVMYLIENPVVREAYFPSASLELTVDAARDADESATLALTRASAPHALATIETWWRDGRDAFRMVRSGDGTIVGFGVQQWASDLPASVRALDPLSRAWIERFERSEGRERDAFFARYVIAAPGHDQGQVAAPLWIDAKRAYVERPQLWAVYGATPEPDRILAQLQPCGFRRLEASLGEGSSAEHSVVLEFGHDGIWTWLRRLIAAEPLCTVPASVPASTPGPDASVAIDEAGRALRVDGVSVALSALEYAVLTHLAGARGRVVTRDELLDAVWKQRFTGSNVVDAVMRLLRKKLGARADALETVRGHGYRLHLGSAQGDAPARAS